MIGPIARCLHLAMLGTLDDNRSGSSYHERRNRIRQFRIEFMAFTLANIC